MSIIIWIIFLGSVESFSNTSNLCFHHNVFVSQLCNDGTMDLCSEHQVIRIKDIQLQKKVTGNVKKCHGCPSDTDHDEVWQNNENITYRFYFEAFLYQACSMRSRWCNFVDDIIKSFEVEEYIWAASIQYECVTKDLVRDICSSWEQVTDSLHIFLDRTENVPNECSCIIEGDPNNTHIEIVDFRPYINVSECANTTVVVDGIYTFQCSENGIDYLYNEDIQVINNVTNITVLLAETLPQMLWIHVKGTNLTVKCNYEEEVHSTFPSTVFTSETTTTKTATTSPETETNTHVPYTKTTTPVLHKGGGADKNIFTIPVIAGGSAGIVTVIIIIVVIVCIACRRKSNRMANNKEKENIYKVQDEQSNTENTTLRNGVINKSYETGNEIIDTRMSRSSNYEEIVATEVNDYGVGNNTEYAVPADVFTDNNSKDDTPNRVQNKSEGHNYIEPYDNAVDKENNKNNYSKVIKLERKNEAYDTCSGVDNYSHIQLGTPKLKPKTMVDNYSHVHISGNKDETSSLGNFSLNSLRQKDDNKTEESSDTYNHIHIETEKQKDSVDTEKETKVRDKNVIESEEEYDHLTKFTHH